MSPDDAFIPSSPGRGRPIDPIAIIGMGCRFPGARSPDEFWRLLRDGVDAIREVPASRFDVDAWYAGGRAKRGRTVTRRGGFLDDVDCFDAAFFDIEPREAVRIDPQHRLVLETAWEALEDAGIPPRGLAGSRTGVFVGMCYNDYEDLLFSVPDDLNLHSMTGASRFSAAGRVSFTLGLEGPSMVVDTACSSSLAAVHLACQSLRLGESSLAIAGGVNVILEPYIHICLSRGSAAAPDGRTKFGDASADGYVRSEGVGLVVLKRLDDAVRDGDRIDAVILGSAMRHKGSGGDGLATPLRDAVVAVMRDACSAAGVSPADVHYVEAHGTGTRQGDAAEIPAIADVLASAGRPMHKCYVGSVKTNIGHTESAAGVAGLIKVVLAFRHRQIPPSLHFETPNPRIAWDELPLEIPRALRPWPADGGRMLAGVNSFGMSGTNGHMVVAGPPPAATDACGERRGRVLCLSAKTDEALRELAARYADFLEESDATLDDVCQTAACGRSHHPRRLAIVADDAAAVQSSLRSFVEQRLSAGLVLPPGVNGAGIPVELAARYVRGEDIDWPSEFPEFRGRRVRLPTYPFARTRYWCRAGGATPAAPEAAATPASAGSNGDRVHAAAAPPTAEQEALTELVGRLVAELIGVSPGHAVDRDRPLHELGFDSMRAVELRERLVTELGREVPVTLVFDYPSVSRMGRFLSELLSGQVRPASAATSEPASASRADESSRIDELRGLPAEQLEAMLLRKLESIERRGES